MDRPSAHLPCAYISTVHALITGLFLSSCTCIQASKCVSYLSLWSIQWHQSLTRKFSSPCQPYWRSLTHWSQMSISRTKIIVGVGADEATPHPQIRLTLHSQVPLAARDTESHPILGAGALAAAKLSSILWPDWVPVIAKKTATTLWTGDPLLSRGMREWSGIL